MKIYTRRGDKGETGLFGGGRIAKDHPRIEATGAVDELNATLGRALTVVEEPRIRERLRVIQNDLFTLGSRIASRSSGDGGEHPNLPPLPDGRPKEMEDWIDEVSEELEALKNFILPGGSAGAAELHVARTVCRRAERRIVALITRMNQDTGGEPEETSANSSREPVDPDILRYLNRLSDLLFAFGRLENRYNGHDDVLWHGPRDRRG